MESPSSPETRRDQGRAVNMPGFKAVLMLACAGIAASVVLFQFARALDEDRVQSDFTHVTANAAGELGESIAESAHELECLGATYGVAGQLSRRQFRDFVKPVLLSDRAGIQAIEWIPRVPDCRRGDYEGLARRDGLASFQFTERLSQGHMVRAGRRAQYFPVYFVEPYEGNEAALGFDLGSERLRRQALASARDSGRMVASPRITLVQEKARQYGFLVFLPVYRQGVAAHSVGQRRANLQGFVLGVFRVGDILDRALANLRPEGINIEIVDNSARAGQRFLASHGSRPDASAAAGALRRVIGLDVAGRKWSAVFTASDDFIAARRTWHPWTILIGSLLLTAAACAYVGLVAGGAARARASAIQMLEAKRALEREVAGRHQTDEALRQSERDFRLVVEASNDAIIAYHEDTRIVIFNPAAERMFGWKAAEVVGEPLDILLPPEAREAVRAEISLAVARGRSGLPAMALEPAPGLRRDGRLFTVEVSVAVTERDGRAFVLASLRDVTERQRIEQALQQSERDFRLVVEASNDAIIAYHEDTRIVIFNPAAERMFGWKAAEVVGEPLDILLPPAARDGAAAAIRRDFEAAIHGEPAMPPFPYPGMRRDGQEFTVEASPALTERDGRPLMLVSLRDVTERERAREQLRFKSTLLETQTEASIDGVLCVDANGKMISFNRRFVEMWEIPQEVTASGSDAGALQSALDKVAYPDEFLAQVRYLYQHREEKSRDEIALRDGRTLDRYSAPVIAPDGTYYGRVWYFRDITERKRAEQALRQSEQDFRAIVEINTDAMFAFDAQGLVTLFNPAAERMFGWSAAEIVGQPVERLISPRIRSQVRANISTALAAGSRGHAFGLTKESWGVRRSGEEFAVEVSPSISEHGGRPVIFTIARDVTERKRVEQALEAKNRELESFVYTVSHDLRAPLISMEGFARLLADEYADRLDDEGRDYLRRVRANVDAMHALLTDLLELSRVGRVEEPDEPVAVSEVVAEVLQELAGPIARSRAQIVAPADLPVVRYSHARLSQVLSNLISNAIKFSKDGEPPRVVLHWEARERDHRFLVTDNGIGIEPGYKQQKVFEIFSRLREKNVEGSGVGLAIVKRIVEERGGEVGVESAPSEGSTFWFTVPTSHPLLARQEG